MSSQKYAQAEVLVTLHPVPQPSGWTFTKDPFQFSQEQLKKMKKSQLKNRRPGGTDTQETKVDDKNNKDEAHEGVPAAEVPNNKNKSSGDVPAVVVAELTNETDTVETKLVDDKNNMDEAHEGVPADDVRNNNHEPHEGVPAAVVAELPNGSSESSYRPNQVILPLPAPHHKLSQKQRPAMKILCLQLLLFRPLCTVLVRTHHRFHCHLMRFPNMVSFIYFMHSCRM